MIEYKTTKLISTLRGKEDIKRALPDIWEIIKCSSAFIHSKKCRDKARKIDIIIEININGNDGIQYQTLENIKKTIKDLNPIRLIMEQELIDKNSEFFPTNEIKIFMYNY
jgi:hypothetical protein